MRIKLDENVPVDLAVLLAAAGHDVMTVYDENLQGAPDDRLVDECQHESRVLMTLDMGFADIRTYPPGSNAGIVVLRPPQQDRKSLLNLVERLVPLLESTTPSRSLWIVAEDRVRIRG